MIAGWWPEAAIYIPWDIWIVTWIAAALWANRTLKRPGGGREWPYRILEVGGFILLLFLFVRHRKAAHHRIATAGFSVSSLLASACGRRLVDGGACHCRVCLLLVGAASSGAAMVRAHYAQGRPPHHRYRPVCGGAPSDLYRHPDRCHRDGRAQRDNARPIGAALLIIGYWMKARLEERFLREELGAAAYDEYSRRVPMLVPLSKL